MLTLISITKPLVLKAIEPTTKVAVLAVIWKTVEKTGIAKQLQNEYLFASTDAERVKVVVKVIAIAVAAGAISTVVAGIAYAFIVDKAYDNDTWITGPFAL